LVGYVGGLTCRAPTSGSVSCVGNHWTLSLDRYACGAERCRPARSTRCGGRRNGFNGSAPQRRRCIRGYGRHCTPAARGRLRYASPAYTPAAGPAPRRHLHRGPVKSFGLRTSARAARTPCSARDKAAWTHTAPLRRRSRWTSWTRCARAAWDVAPSHVTDCAHDSAATQSVVCIHVLHTDRLWMHRRCARHVSFDLTWAGLGTTSPGQA
jgi:hypothetical protein